MHVLKQPDRHAAPFSQPHELLLDPRVGIGRNSGPGQIEGLISDPHFFLEASQRRGSQLLNLLAHQMPKVPAHLVGRAADDHYRNSCYAIGQKEAMAGAARVLLGEGRSGFGLAFPDERIFGFLCGIGALAEQPDE